MSSTGIGGGSSVLVGTRTKTDSRHNVNSSSEEQQSTSIDDTQQYTIRSLFSAFAIGDVATVLYLSAFAMLGSLIRILLGHLFGGDCDSSGDAIKDMQMVSLCVTTSGRTMQRGGALFLDLPANMVGSFFMGLFTPSEKSIPSLPWLKANHRLQHHTPIHISLRTAFCGSLTTFASWNTQMVVMMVGYQTEVGVQVAAALSGYLLGVICAISSFRFGRQVAVWLHEWRDPSLNVHVQEEDAKRNITTTGEMDVEGGGREGSGRGRGSSRDDPMEMESAPDESQVKPPPVIVYGVHGLKCRSFFSCIDHLVHGKYSTFVFVGVIMGGFVMGDIYTDNPFYREMWFTCLLAPPGTLLRWKLSNWNGTLLQNSTRWKWIPFGTLSANALACILSIIAQFFLIQAKVKNDSKVTREMFWWMAIKTGLAGNLSTVSTYAKEIVHLNELFPQGKEAFGYALGSIGICCLLSLCVYLPMMYV
jgi:fluoride ion exporter CrcB/FEX